MKKAEDTRWQMPPDRGLVLMLARRHRAEFVWDAVNLEGIAMTLPEVQTLLDGITVGGHKLSDQQVAVNQGNAWRALFEWIEAGTFEVSVETACALHGIAGKEEALEWGRFRRGGRIGVPDKSQALFPNIFCKRNYPIPMELVFST